MLCEKLFIPLPLYKRPVHKATIYRGGREIQTSAEPRLTGVSGVSAGLIEGVHRRIGWHERRRLMSLCSSLARSD